MEYCSGNSIVGAKKKGNRKKKTPKNNRVNTRSSHVRAAVVLTGREYAREPVRSVSAKILPRWSLNPRNNNIVFATAAETV